MGVTIGFIGAGNMGGALIRGLLDARIPAESIIVADARQDALEDLNGRYPKLRTGTDNRPAAAADIVVLAVKPQVCQTVLQNISGSMKDGTVLVSIAAGINIAALNRWLNRPGIKTVRAMPNSPAMAGAGITALSPGKGVTSEEFEKVRGIFDTVGRSLELPEPLMDAHTALAASSPAWVCMFIEALADGAVMEGLPRKEAYHTAAIAVMGAAKLILEHGSHPGILKDAVCSPGGATIEAVAALEESGFRSAVIQAMKVCTARAKELGES